MNIFGRVAASAVATRARRAPSGAAAALRAATGGGLARTGSTRRSHPQQRQSCGPRYAHGVALLEFYGHTNTYTQTRTWRQSVQVRERLGTRFGHPTRGELKTRTH